MMKQFLSNEEFWNTPLSTRPGKTIRALMDDGLGDPSYSFDSYVSGPYGDRITEYFKTYGLYDGQDMHPDVLEYWLHYGKGLHKYYHDNEDFYKKWCAYVPVSYDLPENRDRRYPCIIIGQRMNTMMVYEASSFIHMAARNEIIVLTGTDVNEDDNFEHMLDEGLRLYPIDPSRVYLHGHSFGAVLSGRHAIKYVKRIAGVCMSGSQYYGADSTDAEIEAAVKLRMPLLQIHCTMQSRNLLPYNQTPRRQMSPKNRMNATTSDFTLLTGYEEVSFWRRINHCKPVGLARMRDIQKLSSDPSENVLGIEFDQTHVEQREGVNHYFGDIYDDQHTLMIRYVAVEGGPHAVPPQAGDIAWDFLSDFSRDLETGALSRAGKAAGAFDPFWTTAYPAIGYRTPFEYALLHAGEAFDPKSFITDDFTASMKKALYTRLHFTGDENGLTAYRAEKNICRERRESLGKNWVFYTPLSQSGALPLVLYLGDTEDVLDSEASGIVEEAIADGMMAALLSDVNDDAFVESVIQELLLQRKLSEGKVFFVGFGFGAQCAGRHAVRLIRHAAGVCLMGDQYYGYDNTHEEVARALEKDLPVVMIHGSCEERGILPLYENSPLPLPRRRAEHVTVSTLSLISSYSEHAFWRQLNHVEQVPLSDMAATANSENDCIRTIGAPVDQTGREELLGVTALTGDILTKTGKVGIRYIAIAGAPHLAFAAGVRLACSFFINEVLGN